MFQSPTRGATRIDLAPAAVAQLGIQAYWIVEVEGGHTWTTAYVKSPRHVRQYVGCTVGATSLPQLRLRTLAAANDIATELFQSPTTGQPAVAALLPPVGEEGSDDPPPPAAPAAKAAKPKKKSRKAKAPRIVCGCPQCQPLLNPCPDGVSYCFAGNEHIAYNEGLYICSGALREVETGLRQHRYEIARRPAA